MPSIYMTNCPTCGCGGTGEYIVARVEWGICAIPTTGQRRGYEMCRLCDYIDFKEADHALIILPADPNTPGVFSETISPFGLIINTIGAYHTIKFSGLPSAPSSCTPDSVAFIENQTLPSGYCFDPANSPLVWQFSNPWPTWSSAMTTYLYAAPYSSCNGTTWTMNYINTADRVNIPLTSGSGVDFWLYYSTGGGAGIYGWLACVEDQYAARDFCHAQAGEPSPWSSGPCYGYTRHTNTTWFPASFSFYLKGRLTYYNV